LFLHNKAPICWKSVKQTVTATSTNHSELLAFHAATKEAVWLHTTNKLIKDQAGLTTASKPITIFEDNAGVVAQVQAGFIKSENTKHVNPQIFSFTQELISGGYIEVQKVESAHNLVDFLTKALPAHTHRRLIQAAGMKLLHELISN
jgi:hypothetical protein